VLDRVILTNDDGIDAPGMAVLEEIAAQVAKEVWVVAPEHDQSGQSHAISLHHAIRVTERGPRRFGGRLGHRAQRRMTSCKRRSFSLRRASGD